MNKDGKFIKRVTVVPEGYYSVKDIIETFNIPKHTVYALLSQIESIQILKLQKTFYYPSDAVDFIRQAQISNPRFADLYTKKVLAEKLNLPVSQVSCLLMKNNIKPTLYGLHKKAYFDKEILLKLKSILKEIADLQTKVIDCYTFEDLCDLMQASKQDICFAFYHLKLKSTYKINGVAYYNADIMYKVDRYLSSKRG